MCFYGLARDCQAKARATTPARIVKTTKWFKDDFHLVSRNSRTRIIDINHACCFPNVYANPRGASIKHGIVDQIRQRAFQSQGATSKPGLRRTFIEDVLSGVGCVIA